MELFETAHPIMNGHKMRPTYFLVVFAIVARQTFADGFPELIQKCKVSDPKFDDCTLNSANNFITYVIKGDEKYNIAPIIAPSGPDIINVTENFQFKFTNMSTTYYENFRITRIRFDFDRKLLVFVAKSIQPTYSGNYEINGEILGKPVHESGKVNMTFDYIEYDAIVTLDFTMKNDKKYLEAVSCIFVANVKNMQFKPYNQVIVGEPMTAEQRQVYQSYISEISNTIKRDEEKHDAGTVQLLNRLFKSLPFEEIFIP